ncbi:hypothetical protein D3C85_936660 [compost metagenome]
MHAIVKREHCACVSVVDVGLTEIITFEITKLRTERNLVGNRQLMNQPYVMLVVVTFKITVVIGSRQCWRKRVVAAYEIKRVALDNASDSVSKSQHFRVATGVT